MARTEPAACPSAPSTARPSWSGIFRSSRTTSGLSFSTSPRHSAPLRPWPTTVMSSSAWSSLQRPSRKMGWSSTTSTRMLALEEGLAIASLGERDLDPQGAAAAGAGVNRQLAAQGPGALADRDRSQPLLLEGALGIGAREREPAAVVVHQQPQEAVVLPQPHHHVLRPSVLVDVVQGLAQNPEHFPADAFGERLLHPVGPEDHLDAGLLLELGAVGQHPAAELAGGDAQRLERPQEEA